MSLEVRAILEVQINLVLIHYDSTEFTGQVPYNHQLFASKSCTVMTTIFTYY